MTNQSRAHAQLEWTKQKLDEIDAALGSIEASVGKTQNKVSLEADQALDRLKSERDRLQKGFESLRADVEARRGVADEVYDFLQASWIDVEIAFQDFLTTISSQTDVVKATIAAQAEAQRQSWLKSIDAVRASASDVVDRARGEVDAAIAQLDDAGKKVEAKLGQASAAGDVSWQALKVGIEETKQAHLRTWKKISEALSNLA